MIKIYIAGPSVFAKNAKEIGEEYKAICKEYYCKGLYPLDSECEAAGILPMSKKIYLANTQDIERADYVVADLNPFRGQCMDDGTAFEIGYAVHAKKPVYGYISDARPLNDKIGTEDENGFNVENFGLPINLMIAESTHIVEGDFEDCIRTMIRLEGLEH
ncbi:nucleoside 2-deoxyribosyltransferase [Candidatus Saccharibacteria bacterium]|nr:nucleoside 2-deoxyribosyltransferase [Candidatus Saccharibacteria bacterium]